MSEPAGLDGVAALSPSELEAECGALLPEKTAMSSIDIQIGIPVDNLAIPINMATAINNSSPESWAVADADQVVIVDQYDDG
jgi:hypothetical protein